MLVARDVTLARAERTLCSGLSFIVSAGEALEVVGPNGAGKSTLLRTIAGFLGPFQGEIQLQDESARVEADSTGPIAERCHFLGHLNGVNGTLTVIENAKFWADYLSGNRPEVAIERVGLAGLADITAAYLSAGQKRRLAVARLMIAPRKLWLLDEPATSLDNSGQELLAQLAAEHLAQSGIIVAATHTPLGFPSTSTLDLGKARSAGERSRGT